MKRFAAIAMLGCAALAAFAVVAAAHTAFFDSTVTIHFKKGNHGAAAEFSGAVSSAKLPCEQRTVKLYEKHPGTADELIATTSSDIKGDWQIAPAAVSEGTYYAKAKRKVLLRNDRHRHVCRRALSKDISVKHT
jgi:hypothetical protein